MGRPSKYESHVKPYLNDVRQYAQYMTEEQIAETLGVALSTFMEYKKKYSELSEAIKKGRAELVKDLRSTLIRKAKGFQYQESKEIIEAGVVVKKEVYTRSALPDVAALNLLLKNYDSDNWANDPQMLEVRKKELELQELKVKDSTW